MPQRKEISNSVIDRLKEDDINRDERAIHSWFSANESLLKIELVLLRSYLLFHLVHELGSMVISQLQDLVAKARLW